MSSGCLQVLSHWESYTFSLFVTDDKISDLSKSKAFADDKLNVAQN